MSTRRGLLTGLGALLIAAPAIVRATSIMPVRAWREPQFLGLGEPYDGMLPFAMLDGKPMVLVARDPQKGEYIFSSYDGIFTFSAADARRRVQMGYTFK